MAPRSNGLERGWVRLTKEVLAFAPPRTFLCTWGRVEDSNRWKLSQGFRVQATNRLPTGACPLFGLPLRMSSEAPLHHRRRPDDPPATATPKAPAVPSSHVHRSPAFARVPDPSNHDSG